MELSYDNIRRKKNCFENKTQSTTIKEANKQLPDCISFQYTYFVLTTDQSKDTGECFCQSGLVCILKCCVL